jgi:hypothetical protein
MRPKSENNASLFSDFNPRLHQPIKHQKDDEKTAENPFLGAFSTGITKKPEEYPFSPRNMTDNNNKWENNRKSDAKKNTRRGRERLTESGTKVQIPDSTHRIMCRRHGWQAIVGKAANAP